MSPATSGGVLRRAAVGAGTRGRRQFGRPRPGVRPGRHILGCGNLILWVTHGASALTSAPDWSGKLSKLTGANLATYQDFVINFPRSFKDHMTNSIAFRPTQASVLLHQPGQHDGDGRP